MDRAVLNDVYASHVPVLEALTPPPKKVLEFGAGNYSTQTFLEMDSVTKLVSIETNADWRETVRQAYKDDRWTLLDGTTIPTLTEFDLIFIDDGQGPQQRIETIAFVLKQKHPRVVIHDAEYQPYRETIESFSSDFEVEDGYSPYTAIVAATPPPKKKAEKVLVKPVLEAGGTPPGEKVPAIVEPGEVVIKREESKGS